MHGTMYAAHTTVPHMISAISLQQRIETRFCITGCSLLSASAPNPGNLAVSRSCWSVDAGAGTVTSVTQVDCTTYTVQGYMPQNDPFEVNSTTVVLRLNEGVASACSGQFPAASQLVAVDHR